MKKMMIAFCLMSLTTTAFADVPVTLDEMTYAQRSQDLEQTSKNAIAALEGMDAISDAEIKVLGSGTQCFLVGNAMAHIRVTRVLNAGNKQIEADMNVAAQKALSLRNRFCK